MAEGTIPSAGDRGTEGRLPRPRGWPHALLGSEGSEFLKLDPGQVLKEIALASLRPRGNSCTHTAGWTDGGLLT